uniref:Uncharacterized protein n=1 Tax=Arundo donax TaxID=35708 RepID=A0A0A9GZ75_ARUDO
MGEGRTGGGSEGRGVRLKF